ncbi:hypothetical protein BDW74DRAFT_25387 [Aspergillus multicolor]|uniref:uncharacterized protein n=1 Tax=Aspergillus multicolor TaxID=41759 RepID=UPI003CCD4454
MARAMNNQFTPLLALLAWTTLWISVDSTSSLTYCSSDNTGTGSANFSIYQSNGNCEDHCSDSAFAILLDKNCWCSDIAPNDDDNVDTSKCDDGCPGYPDDSCGNSDDSLYAYIQLGSPSGTASASTTKSTSTSTSTKSSTSTTSSENSTTSTDSDSTTTIHSSVTETQTHGGLVTTITVDSSSATKAADSSNPQQADSDSDSGLSGGSIAGIVVGVVGGIALVVAAIIFFLAKRRQNDPTYQGAGIDGRQSKGSNMSYANIGDNHSHTLSNGSSNIPQRMPTFTDNRLNTGAMLRRDSDVSLQDNEDYSRPVLRLTNPD